MAGAEDPPAPATPAVDAAGSGSAGARATEPQTAHVAAALPQPDLEAAQAPPMVTQAPPAGRGWRDWFKKKAPAGEQDAAATVAAAGALVAPDADTLPPSSLAGAGREQAVEPAQAPPRKWPEWTKCFWLRRRPPHAGADAGSSPASGAAAEAGGAAGGAAAAAGGTSWFAWPRLGGRAWVQLEPEPWCIDYVKLGRWASLVFTTWQELCFTSGVHPFTGASMDASSDDAAEPKAGAGPKARTGAAPPPAGRAAVQGCFLRACANVQDQLTRETAGLMVVAVLLAVAAAALIASLSLRGDWEGGDYAAYVLLILSAACSLTHLACGASVYLAAAGRPPRSFFRLLLTFEPLVRAGVASFFAAITTLLAGLLAFAFTAAWAQRDSVGNGAGAAQVSVLFLALAAIYYAPNYIAGRWLLRCQDKHEGRSRIVSKATLLSSLEPLLAWSFADHTIPPAFRSDVEQAGQWEPLRRYCEAHSYEVYREFELLPPWQAWFVRAANLMLSTLGPPSLLRLRPTGSPFQFDALERAACQPQADGKQKEAEGAAAEEAAAASGDLEAPPTFSAQLEE